MNTTATRKPAHRPKILAQRKGQVDANKVVPLKSAGKVAKKETLKAPAEPQVFASVFDAIADTAEEAANMKARAELARQIISALRKRGWTQEEAAEHCRVTQPRISDLVNGRLSRFSLDALVNIASVLGEVSVQLEPA